MDRTLPQSCANFTTFSPLATARNQASASATLVMAFGLTITIFKLPRLINMGIIE